MHYLNNNAQEYEESLQQARTSLLNAAFDQFWIQSERSPLIEKTSSSSSNSTTLKTQSSWSNHLQSQSRILLLIFILLLLALPFIILSQTRANRFLHQCSSLACISASHRIIENLDMNINPCDNFYRYACDGWINTHFLTPSQTSIGYFREIYQKNLIMLYKILIEHSATNSQSHRKFKQYFNSCMNTSNNEKTTRKTLLNILAQVGLPPLLSEQWSSKNFNLVTSLIYTHQHKINPLFRMGITTDEKNNHFHRIYFEQSGLSFEERMQYDDRSIRYLFNQFGVKLSVHLHSFQSPQQISQQIDEIFRFEKRLASIFQRKKSPNPFKSYHSRTYEQIRAWFSSWFDIDTYLESIFHANRSIFSNQTFLISTPDYFERLKTVIQTTPRYLLANYVSLQVIQELLPYLPESFMRIRRPLIARLRGVKEEKQLWEICVKRTDDAFGFATGALLISKIFNEQNRERIEHIVEEIRAAFIETLPNIHWMDLKTQQRAQMKARMIIDRLGYPKWIEDEKKIDQYYQNLTLSPANNPIINTMLVRKFQKEQNLKKLGHQPDIEEWTMTPIDVNAYYAPWKNMIVFPAGILQTPFFDPNIPISLNFGSIASIIGHELIHAFDASGRYFDGYGNLNNWWQRGSARSFDRHAQCFIDQYAHYREDNGHVNGVLTLDENIADNGGLQIAYSAYKRYLKRHHLPSIKRHRRQQLLPGLNLTDEQLFFIGFAQTWCTKTTPEMAKLALITDPHAPTKYRVIGTLSNMPEFAKAFGCPRGSPMSSRKRCQICHTLPREIVTINGQESIVCLPCAEKQYSYGEIPHLSFIQSHMKHNTVLALLNRTFRTLYELNDLINESKDHIEQKKAAIKEGVLTCLTYLRSTSRENNQITPINDSKKKIIIKKKTFNILQHESDEEEEEEEDDDDDVDDKENQSTTPLLDENAVRRKTVRGSNSSKRSVSSKKQDHDSPSKRTKKTKDLDEPLTIISPTVVKKITPTRKKTNEEGEKEKVKSLRLARKVHDSKPIETMKLIKKQKTEETNTEEEGDVQEKPLIPRKKATLAIKPSMDIRNDKGESLIHQAVKKGDIKRVKQLIDDGHSVNTIDHNSWTPLHEACSLRNIPLMELLLANHANINVQGGTERMTVLHEAVSSENSDETIIEFLLQNGADPYIENRDSKTAIDLVSTSTKSKLTSPLDKIPCQKPSHNELPIAPPPRRRVRTTSSTNILFFTGFDKARKESFIKSVQTIFGRKCATTAKHVENNVTHVITCGEVDRVAFRTINYLRGIVLGKWIVSEKWIEECIKQKQWIDETAFEVLGSQLESKSNGSHTSRIKHEKNETLLFAKCQFYLYGQFHTYKKEDLTDLIKITGAVLLKREPKLHRIDSDTDLNNTNQSSITYIIYESSMPDVLLDNNRIKHLKLLDFLTCIDHYDTHGRLD